MSSTSTNKQPLLVDRPLHAFTVLGSASCLTTQSDFSSLVAGGLVPLVDCVSNDGAVVDSIHSVATQAGTTGASVIAYLSLAATIFGVTKSNTAAVGSMLISSSAPGERSSMSLPGVNVPVPHLGALGNVDEFDKKATAIYVPAGSVLYVGLSTPIVAPTPITTVNVFAQGGYF